MILNNRRNHDSEWPKKKWQLTSSVFFLQLLHAIFSNAWVHLKKWKYFFEKNIRKFSDNGHNNYWNWLSDYSTMSCLKKFRKRKLIFLSVHANLLSLKSKDSRPHTLIAALLYWNDHAGFKTWNLLITYSSVLENHNSIVQKAKFNTKYIVNCHKHKIMAVTKLLSIFPTSKNVRLKIYRAYSGPGWPSY